MRYDEARSSIRSGDLLAWRGEGFVGRLIRHWTGASWSHVGIAWRFRGRVFVLEAREGSGVGLRAVSNCLPFDHIGADSHWSEDVESFALEHLGKPYSYPDFVRAGLGLRPGFEGEICSEYAAKVLRQAGVFASGLTPADLVSSCLELGGEMRAVRP